MDNNPFEALLTQVARDIEEEIQAGKPMNTENVMFILRKWFNPFPDAARDSFARLIKLPGTPPKRF